MTNQIKKALVVGATGLVGNELVQQLIVDDCFDEITLLTRRSLKTFNNHKKIEVKCISNFMDLTEIDFSEFTSVFSCLGTTIKKAGSKQAFYDIDYGINLNLAEAIKQSQANIHFVLVSAIGADPNSSFFYNRVKGQLERDVQLLNLYKTSIIRPSLLVGQREETRKAEDLAKKIYSGISQFIPKRFKYKPVTAKQVAHTMVEISKYQTEKFRIYDNLEIQK